MEGDIYTWWDGPYTYQLWRVGVLSVALVADLLWLVGYGRATSYGGCFDVLLTLLPGNKWAMPDCGLADSLVITLVITCKPSLSLNAAWPCSTVPSDVHPTTDYLEVLVVVSNIACGSCQPLNATSPLLWCSRALYEQLSPSSTWA